MIALTERLEKSTNFDQVFEVVKRAVETTLHMHRAGLTLVLAEMPTHVGAYHILGSNMLVMNRKVLNVVSVKAKSSLELNSFIFYILAHEYLHSLGFTSEEEVRQLVQRVSSENFGAEHPATEMAQGQFADLYPELRQIPPNGEISTQSLERSFEVVKEFDMSSMPYIG